MKEKWGWVIQFEFKTSMHAKLYDKIKHLFLQSFEHEDTSLGKGFFAYLIVQFYISKQWSVAEMQGAVVQTRPSRGMRSQGR